MYLELSARQSGKTTRLIEQVIKDLSEDKSLHATVVCLNGQHCHNIRVKIPRDIIDRVHCISSSNCWFGILEDRYNSDSKYYFDDFCEYRDSDVPILENGYYASTPRTRSSNILRRILICNDHKYETYKSRNFEENNYPSTSVIDATRIDCEYSLETFYKFYPNNKSVIPEELFQM